MMKSSIRRLVANVKKARKLLEVALLDEFPVGAKITWLARNGKYPQTGVVQYNGNLDAYEPELRVVNDRTGALVWVRLWQEPRRLGE